MIPVNEPLLDGRERALLQECVDTGWISSDGPFVGRFEEAWSGYLGVGHGIAVCNGTAALETALYAAGVGEGDEVVMPSFTIISCALAALRLGARPVLVDIEPDTWCMDVARVAERITPRTRAVMAVHMYGHPVDMDPLLQLAERHGLVILEDAAQVHGAEYRGRKCGSIGQVASFSFYANKIVTTGEGGMVVTSDDAMAERARSYRNLCFQPGRRFYHEHLGYNFRMSNLQAAVGVAQVERIEELVARKRRFGALYREALAALPGVRTQVEREWAKTVYWMYCIELDEALGLTAAEVMAGLRERGVGTRPFFLGLHEQPVLRDLGVVTPDDPPMPVTERAAHQGLYLPSGLTLTEQQVHQVVDALSDVLRRASRRSAG